MTRTKKILVGILIAILALLFIAFLAVNWLLDSASREALAKLSQRAGRHGVVVADPQFDHARIAGLKTVRWTDFSTRLQFPESDSFAPNKAFDLHVGEAEISLIGGGQAILEARDISVDSTFAGSGDAAVAPQPTDKEEIRAERFRCQFPLDLFHPAPGLEQALPELLILLRGGASKLPLEAEGTLEFMFDGAPIKSRLKVNRVDDGYALVLNAEDLQPVGGHFDEPVTDAELDLIANYPLRASQLLRIKNDAETTAAAAKQGENQVPQDAYRHTLWSFLLTRQYGPQFAQRVTNAHEQDAPGNTAAARKMDLNNNALGRTWAAENLGRNDILERVRTDPAVIREPQ